MTEPIDREGGPENPTEKVETFLGHRVIPQFQLDGINSHQTREDSLGSEISDEMLADFLAYFRGARHKLVMDLKPATFVYYKFNDRLFEYREEDMGQMRGSNNYSNKLYSLTGMLDGSHYYYTDQDIANVREGTYEKIDRDELAMAAGYTPRENDPVEALIKDSEAEVTFSTVDQLERLYVANNAYERVEREFKRKLYSGKNYKFDGSNPEVLEEAAKIPKHFLGEVQIQERIIPAT